MNTFALPQNGFPVNLLEHWRMFHISWILYHTIKWTEYLFESLWIEMLTCRWVFFFFANLFLLTWTKVNLSRQTDKSYPLERQTRYILPTRISQNLPLFPYKVNLINTDNSWRQSTFIEKQIHLGIQTHYLPLSLPSSSVSLLPLLSLCP